jgi:hypothetical protein
MIPKKIIRRIIGKQSTRLPLLKKLPVNMLDKMMSNTFGLDKLKK